MSMLQGASGCEISASELEGRPLWWEHLSALWEELEDMAEKAEVWESKIPASGWFNSLLITVKLWTR